MSRFRILSREFFRLSHKEGKIVAVIFLPLLLWRRLRNADLQSQRELDPSGGTFDKCYGVDTRGVIPMAHLSVSEPSWIHGCGYQGVVPDELEILWPSLGIDYSKSAFIDIGAGKGRALMLASKLPFKRIIGVEIAHELCVITNANLRIFNTHDDCRAQAEVLCADASSYEFPLEPIVVFLYNPFGTPTMQKVIANLIESLRTCPRAVVVIYVRPELADLWDLVPGFTLAASAARLRIYDNRPLLERHTSSTS